MNDKLDLTYFDQSLLHLVRKEFDAGNPGLIHYTSNQWSLAVVFTNVRALKAKGIYEECLVRAYVGSRTNNRAYTMDDLFLLFGMADKSKLRSAGDPLPGPGPFRVYRGVAGVGRSRRVRSFSWTGSLDVACWFATRYPKLESPAVFQMDVQADYVLFHSSDRSEDEFVCVPGAVKRVKMTGDEMAARAEEQSRRQKDEHAAFLAEYRAKTA
jgi:hypothetical protein